MSAQDAGRGLSECSALLVRLYAHADSHEYIAGNCDEQKQWMNDLRHAAGWMEQMKVALQIVHTWASVPGALNAEHVRRQCANALRRPNAEAQGLLRPKGNSNGK